MSFYFKDAKIFKKVEINRKKESVKLPIFPLQSGNEIRQNIFQRKVYLLCASAPFSARWRVWFAMLFLIELQHRRLRLRSAYGDGMGYNYLFKMEWQ
jgi:hypothetical protein